MPVKVLRLSVWEAAAACVLWRFTRAGTAASLHNIRQLVRTQWTGPLIPTLTMTGTARLCRDYKRSTTIGNRLDLYLLHFLLFFPSLMKIIQEFCLLAGVTSPIFKGRLFNKKYRALLFHTVPFTTSYHQRVSQFIKVKKKKNPQNVPPTMDISWNAGYFMQKAAVLYTGLMLMLIRLNRAP